MKFKTGYSNRKDLHHGELNKLPSMTIPDQTMSVAEILSRYARGLPITGERVPIYNGEDDPLDGIDISKMDYAEREELLNNVKSEVNEIKSKYKKDNLQGVQKPMETKEDNISK